MRKIIFKKIYFFFKDLYISYLKKTGNWKRFADIRFHDAFGRYINWNNPKDLNEWINYFAYCTNTDLWVKCADKFAVREYVKSKVGGAYFGTFIGKVGHCKRYRFR